MALNDCRSTNSDAALGDEAMMIFSNNRCDSPLGLLIVDIANVNVWRLSSTLINLNGGKQKLGAN